MCVVVVLYSLAARDQVRTGHLDRTDGGIGEVVWGPVGRCDRTAGVVPFGLDGTRDKAGSGQYDGSKRSGYSRRRAEKEGMGVPSEPRCFRLTAN